jgi:hypothetical protein
MPVPLQAIAGAGAVVENPKKDPVIPEYGTQSQIPGNPQDPYYFQYF